MATRIDDRNLKNVTYTGAWIGNGGGSTTEYNGTVTSSTNVGDYFTVSFRGTGISVFGTFDITSTGVVTTYSVDGAPISAVTCPGGSDDTLQQQFWRSNPLTYGDHKLLVNMSKVNYNPQPGEGTVWFDYFLVTDPNITSSGSPTPSPSSTGTNQKDLPVGAIVGAIVGGLFFFLALGFFLLLYRRHARIRLVEETFEAYPPVQVRQKRMSIQPFVLTAEDSTLSSNPNSTSTDNSQYSPGSLVTIPPPILPSRKSAIREYGSHQSMRATIIVDNADSHAVETQPEPVPGPSRDIQEPERVNIGPGTVHSGRKNHRPNVNISTDAQAPSTSAGPENTSNPAELVDVPPPVQHVDSGVRDSAIEPVELPPVYSPT